MMGSAADTYQTTPEALAVQDIPGGTCPVAPIQVCMLWATQQEKVISPLAFKVYFTAQEVKYWRSQTPPGGSYHYQPYGFHPSDVSRLLPGIPQPKIAKAFAELEAARILTISDTGIAFAQHLDDLTVPERVKRRIQVMFDHLHENTRDKIIKIPRRLLKLIVQCGRRIVRAATLLGMLLTTMLTKRTDQYAGYKGCCKAQWIANLFGVNAKRVNLERARLIAEGWFRRLPTPQRVRQHYGEWVALNLTPLALPTPGEKPTASAAQVQPPLPQGEAQVQPPLLKPDSPSEIEENQKPPLPPPAGAYQPQHPRNPTWTDIQPDDLRLDSRSEALYQQAIQRGCLKPTPADRINFFAAIAHALRVAKHNACGLLRTLVEKGFWHVISQADEYNAMERLKRTAQAQQTQPAQPMSGSLFLRTPTEGPRLVEVWPLVRSKDALVVETLTADLKQAGVGGDPFALVQRHGYLQDWDRRRWERAEREVAQARLFRVRQRYERTRMVRARDVIPETVHEDQPPVDWGYSG